MDNKKNKLFSLMFSLIICSIFPLLALAEGELIYKLQVPLLGIVQVNSGGVMDYLVALYKFGTYITIAFAFLGLVYGGFVYMISGDNSGMKQHGRDYIWGAVWGLLIIFGSWTLLNTINPELVKFKLPGMEIVKNTTSTPSTSQMQWTHISYTWQCRCEGLTGCSKESEALNPESRFVDVSSDKCQGTPMPTNCKSVCQGYFITGGKCQDQNCGGAECCDYQMLEKPADTSDKNTK
ncbi:MAG TPA: hypothetical protein ENL06_02510 [Candidatus Portnoybacteria bacterium]|nr:hypothetical protein [Candidatus Portnoybacteria bacterium]